MPVQRGRINPLNIDVGDLETGFSRDNELNVITTIPQSNNNHADEIKIDDDNCSSSQEQKSDWDLLYKLNEIPPWYTTLFCGIQVFIIGLNIFSFPLFLSKQLCIPDTEEGNVAKANIVATLFFSTGITTIMQTAIGIRLPIMQGLSGAHVPPTLTILSLPHNICPPPLNSTNFANSSVTLYNDTDGSIVDGTELWQRRMREIQGAIAVSSILEVAIGGFGLVGLLLKYVGPVTVVPTITLTVLILFPVAAEYAEKQWGVALLIFVIIVACSQYLEYTTVPIPNFSLRTRSCRLTRVPIFNMFSILLALIIGYVLCAILTYTDAVPNDPSNHAYGVRTDIRGAVVSSTPWFRFPYPGQWGLPTLSVAGFVAMLSAVLASVVQTIGDYYASARAAGAPPPPAHAINRGIFTEGVASVISGMLGSGVASTSFLTGVAAISITRVGSRMVMIAAGGVFTAFGLLAKLGSLFVTVPDPIIGGLLLVVFSSVIAVALQGLSYVDLNSRRNTFIVGSTIFISLTVSRWSQTHPFAVNTGVTILDQVITVLLQSSVFLGCIMSMFLDNTIPGTRKERGIDAWIGVGDDAVADKYTAKDYKESYDLPFPTKCLGFIYRKTPILPGYKSGSEKIRLKSFSAHFSRI